MSQMLPRLFRCSRTTAHRTPLLICASSSPILWQSPAHRPQCRHESSLLGAFLDDDDSDQGLTEQLTGASPNCLAFYTRWVSSTLHPHIAAAASSSSSPQHHDLPDVLASGRGPLTPDVTDLYGVPDVSGIDIHTDVILACCYHPRTYIGIMDGHRNDCDGLDFEGLHRLHMLVGAQVCIHMMASEIVLSLLMDWAGDRHAVAEAMLWLPVFDWVNPELLLRDSLTDILVYSPTVAASDLASIQLLTLDAARKSVSGVCLGPGTDFVVIRHSLGTEEEVGDDGHSKKTRIIGGSVDDGGSIDERLPLKIGPGGGVQSGGTTIRRDQVEMTVASQHQRNVSFASENLLREITSTEPRQKTFDPSAFYYGVPDLRLGDVIIAGSDGFFDNISLDEIQQVVDQAYQLSGILGVSEEEEDSLDHLLWLDLSDDISRSLHDWVVTTIESPFSDSATSKFPPTPDDVAVVTSVLGTSGDSNDFGAESVQSMLREAEVGVLLQEHIASGMDQIFPKNKKKKKKK